MLYDRIKDNPSVIRKLAAANKLLTALGYIAYPLLLILLALFDRGLLTRCIVVPAAAFITVSIFRYLFNAPRPYENGGRPALIQKTTKGKSFPSRHTFCMFLIACTWMIWQPIVGIVLLICSVFMAVTRVALGVHFPRDVIAGAIIAIGCAIIGYCLIPWI